MKISIKGARVHNLKDIDAEFTDGLTAVTGISGSGKTSLVFDTLYSEARRKFLGVFSYNFLAENLAPADVRSIDGLCPVTALRQNLVNRNPNSILATASGIHPFLRMLYANFGTQSCSECGNEVTIRSRDEIVREISHTASSADVVIYAPIVNRVRGSHTTLLGFLVHGLTPHSVFADGEEYEGKALDPLSPHDIFVRLGKVGRETGIAEARRITDPGISMGVSSFVIEHGGTMKTLSFEPVCPGCGASVEKTHPKFFHFPCPYCGRKGCDRCRGTGLHPIAASVTWNGRTIIDLLELSVDEAHALFAGVELPGGGTRLKKEIVERLEALRRVGLGYVGLDRPSPTLSRGESQRLRLAVALTSRLSDIIHVLDEPTIGLHPTDVVKLMPGLRGLGGPVIFVEHDALAVCDADRVLDIGPGAGAGGGRIVYSGTPYGLWKEKSESGRYFSSREKAALCMKRDQPAGFIEIRGARAHNLKRIDVRIPLARLTVVTGVSGSGKSTLVESLVSSIRSGTATGCDSIRIPPDRRRLTTVYVDQNPIGTNPRSNPATYTGLANVIREVFSAASGKPGSIFSFNTSAGSCPECGGTGAVEVRMRYLPSAWIECSACGGKRFSDEAVSVRIRLGGAEVSIADMYRMSVDEAISTFERDEDVTRANKKRALTVLRSLGETGLGYLGLGQSSPSLSGGEAQRIKLAKYLSASKPETFMLVLDEPTTGLHPSNVRDLLAVLSRLVDAGTTVVVIEHDTDVMKSADWIVDLGPGAGPAGGGLVYQGDAAGLRNATGSLTARALAEAEVIDPKRGKKDSVREKDRFIEIKNARANNLKGVSVRIPKSRLTVVTGVSGSGKSSLVHDILENEAKHLFFESLSVYERYATREKTEIMADSVRGLGITMSIGAKPGPRDMRLSARSTVGTVSEIAYHLGVILSLAGRRPCPSCGREMERGNAWRCPSCGKTCAIGEPRHFLGFDYASACTECNGVGTVSVPNPGKLVRHPDKPLCAGAMYSPGFFPQGYLCKPFNGGYYIVTALARKYGFDPFALPWNEMTKEAQDAFLFGDTQLRVIEESKTGRTRTYDLLFRGFYGTWLRDWDTFGTYTDIRECPACKGSKLRAEYNAVTIRGKNIRELSGLPLARLRECMDSLGPEAPDDRLLRQSLDVVERRLGFLVRSGLGYVSLGRLSITLSAGEAERVRLAALLGSELHSITVLLDEPTRGLHPAETGALVECLRELTRNDNTVVVVEHDPLVIASADHVIDMGPGSGANGGRVVFEGTPEEMKKAKTVTGISLRKLPRMPGRRPGREPGGWFVIRGARENNLKIDEARIPYGMLTGVCGVSGSGKSTLLVDTIGRILSPVRHTTSISYEPLAPGAYDEIENPPEKTVIIDQAINDITNPADYLGISRQIEKYFSQSDERRVSGVDPKLFKRCCSACRGRGWIKTDFSFLPGVTTGCAACSGSGYPGETGSVVVRGRTLADSFALTIDEAAAFFGDDGTIRGKCDTASKCGIGYLVLRQSGRALSGGEVQRLKIAGELSGGRLERAFYILDEPTVGLHLDDVARLIAVLRELVDSGGTVVVIEHHPGVLSSCDWLIELGPGGGEDGGRIVYAGDPAGIAAAGTRTSSFLKETAEAGL